VQYLTQDQRMRRVDLIAEYLANGRSICFRKGGPHPYHALDSVWYDEHLDRARGWYVHGDTGQMIEATFTDEHLRDMLRYVHA
jgi:hypothetical protein